MKKKDIGILAHEDIFKLIGKEWMLVSAGTIDNFNTMTASWGCLGWLWNRPVAVVFIRPERYTHAFIEDNARMTLCFFGDDCRKALQICGSKSGRDCDKVAEAGLHPVSLAGGEVGFSEARLTLVCRKLFKSEMVQENFIAPEIFSNWYHDRPGGGLHSIYIAEIEEVYDSRE